MKDIYLLLVFTHIVKFGPIKTERIENTNRLKNIYIYPYFELS